MEKKYKIVLLTVLTLSVFAIAIVELTGISSHSIGWWRDRHEGEASLYDRENNRTYRGEIYPDQERTRDQIVHDMPKTTMQFYETKYSFGTISRGATVKHSFRFKNTGQNSLMIAKADVECNCTVSGFPPEAIAPDQEGEITVQFTPKADSNAVSQWVEKRVVVHANTMPESVALKIDATVQ